MKSLIVLLFFLFPSFLLAQKIDTAAVEKQIDSLIQVSRTFGGQRKYEQTLEVNSTAENRTIEKLGLESAANGSCCFNHGRIYYFRSDYQEAKEWYSKSLTI